jgi:hypothetical protein
VTGAVNGDTFTESFATTAVLSSPAGTYPITPSAAGANLGNYTVVINSGILTVTQATPIVTWNNPASITYGTALSNTQLNATASVPGNFTYTPAAGTILNSGTQTLSVTFTPTDATDYKSVTQTVQIIVNQATLTVTAANASRIYNTANPTFTGTVTGTVNGDTFTESFTTTAILSSPAGTYPITPAVAGANLANYTVVVNPGILTVTQATPIVTWNNPAAITYGTALSATQLNATASIPGGFVYTPAAGVVLNAGTQTLSVTFTPTDTTDYKSVTQTVQIVVNKATLTVTATDASRAYNTPNPTFTGTVTGAVNGDTFTESFTTTAVLTSAVGPYPIIPSAAGSNLANYTVVINPGILTVTQASPVVTWSNPAAISYGTALSATQLNATASVPGGFVYTPAAGVVLNAGTQTLSVTFTPTDSTDYKSLTQTVQIVVNKATLTLTAANASRIYNTANPTFTGTVSGVVNGDTFTESFTTTAILSSPAGTYPITPSAAGANLANYTVIANNGTLTITQATPVVTWNNPASITYGTALSNTQLNAAASVPGNFAYTPAAGTILGAGTQTLSVTFTPTDTTDYTTITQTVSLIVTKATPVITWNNPASITYGTALSNTQLNATASVPGSFAYTPAAGTILTAGTQTLSVTFTPTDATNYTTASKTVALSVTQAMLTVSADNASRTYNTPNPPFTGTVTGAVNGDTFTETFTTTATLGSPAGTYPITPSAAGSNLANYTVVVNTGTLTITQATPVVTWNNPAAITYGTALSTSQLNATASVPGSFAYTPAAGAVLAVGTQTLSVTFTPADATDYKPVTQTVQIIVNKQSLVVTAGSQTIVFGGAVAPYTASIAGFVNGDTQASSVTGSPSLTTTPASPTTVGIYPITAGLGSLASANYTFTFVDGTLSITKATPVVTWNNPASITFGTTLSSTQLNATASVPGSFVYTPAAGTTPATGTDTLSVTFTPTDSTDYTTVTKTVQITVIQATPVITWNNPANITFGTTLSSTQLNATASVPGSFVYTPAAGTTPATGTDTLSVTFTPTDSTNYTTATKTVQITVTQAAPVITWNNPAAITYGTPLSATQLNATATVPGVFTYAPAAGSIPAAGTDTLSVTFTPTDTTDYTTVTKTVQLIVNQATPVITWNNPASITYGTPLSATQLNATATVPGVFTYAPAAGSVPAAGTDTLSVTFTPTDSTNYTSATKTVQITVTQATPVITWATPANITYGTALSSTQLNATASVPGTMVYTPAAGSVLTVGANTLSVTFTPTDTTNYTTASKTVTLTVSQATPVITWADPASITYGTALSAVQLNATASVPGTLVYTPAAGSILPSGTDTLSVTFTPTDTTNYATATKAVSILVTKQSLVVTAGSQTVVYGTAVAPYTATISGFVNGDTQASSVTGTPSLTTTPTSPTTVGIYPIVAAPGSLASANYSFSFVNGTLSITAATPIVTWANPGSITYGTALSPTQLNASANVGGSFVYSPAAGSVPVTGTDTLSVTFTPTDSTDYTPVTKTVQITVTQATPVITWADPASITYGTPLSATQLNASASVLGSFVYNPAAGTVLAAGTDSLSVTFTPTDSTNYTTATKTVQIAVTQAAPVITWAPPASITYGTALSAAQLNATASVPGTLVYTPAAGSILTAGSDTLSVTFTPNDTTNYTTVTKTVTLLVTQATPVISWANPASITYGTALSTAQLNATSSVPGTMVYAPVAGSIPAAGTDTLSVTFTPTDTTNYTTATKTVTLVVTQATPTITWADPASITYGTALSAVQLNATASVPGTLVYTPAAGNVPVAGTDTLSVTFTPTDTTNYTTATKTVQINVTQAAPVITWAPPASITYGTALSGAQLNATASVPGTLVYTPAAGNIPAAGNDILSVTFTPTDTTNYTTATKTVTLTVMQAAPVITWTNPAPISYGTALSSTQLNATASVPGTLVYTPAAGAISGAGTDTLSVTFTPTDTNNYTTVTKTVQIIVTQAAPVITWANPASIVYGTALSNTQLDATASVPGSFVYTPAAGSIPPAGVDTLSVTFTPTDTVNYTTAIKSVTLTVTQATPVITWANPASITYGTALSATQLNATASVPGTLVYTPAAGSIPSAGTDTLSVTFTPTDATSYSTVTKTVTLTVTQAAPVITWADPASITYGTALSATQLNATASVPGTLVYSPAAGSIPAAGTDTLSVTFTPTDTVNYTTATKSVTLNVTQATPAITWANPASITYGTALSATQLNATASVPGTFVYTPAAGSIPAAGTDTLSVTFTPTDTVNYTTATKSVTLNVTQATPVITWSNPASITYGTALSGTQLNATASVPGTLVYTPAAGSIPAAGTDTLTVAFTPTDTVNSTTATATVQLTVTQATPTITWATPASITYGTALSATQLNATASVPGTLVYTPASGSIPAAGTDTLSVTFTPTDTTNFTTATKTVQISVTQAAPVITWANPANITYGTPLSATQLNASASTPGSFVYTPAAGTVLSAGSNTLSVTFSPTDTTSYTTVTKTVTLIVTQATPVITWVPPAAINYGTTLSATQLNATASVPGSLVYTPAAGSVPTAGIDTLSVTFTPTDTTNYTAATKTVQITVNQDTPGITWATPAPITYGTALSALQLDATTSDPGTLTYTPAAGTIPPVGINTLSVTFTPTDTTNHSSATATVQLVVNKATPVITWTAPASITYGTALSNAQLDATASVPGTFAYTPALGSVPASGIDTLSVTFTPTDTTDYTTVTQTVTLTVTQAAPVISWVPPASITYGTALSGTQLNASASVPGTLVYTPAAGTVLAAGTSTLSVTFTPTDGANYSTVSKSVQITVTQAAPTITWAPPANITYGTALSATQLNASASVPGALVYTPAAGTVLAAGTSTLSVTLTPTDTTNYSSVTKTVPITVTQAAATITWANPADIVYGTALSSTQLDATASVPGSLVYTPAAGTIPAAGTDTLSVTFTPTDTTNYSTITKTVTLIVTQAAPVITWAPPASITYGTALSATQLNATASVPGTLVYTPAAGVVPAAGTDTLSVTFTPNDTTNYSTATKTVTLTVTQAAPVITWANPASIVYGTALSATQLNASASVPGTLAYTPAAGVVPPAGTDTLSVTFTPTDTANYSTATKTVTLIVTQVTPTITWATLSPITYGTSLTSVQLNATASVPGTLVYTPAAGSVPAAGTVPLTVTFTPTDTTNYTTATKTVQLTVNQATPGITWNTPAAITYGTALSGTQLNATTSDPGTLSYTPPAGTVLPAGTNTLTVTFTPTDTTNNSSATKSVQLVVNQATPTITWATPAGISYGTALSSTQLNATASVPGTFVYMPAAGSIPAAGTDTLSVTFTPTDTANYSTVTASVQLAVSQTAPVITWANPAGITYGTALSAAQLNATASVPGTLVYTPAAGSVPAAGTDTLSVTFTPTDTTNYTTATKTVQITVTQAGPVITWANPASIPYGTALSATQLNATASVPGTLVYTPAAGSVPSAGIDTLSVTFTPTDTANYTTATKTVQIDVTQAAPVITWANPANITYGTALSATQLNATASVPGTLLYAPAAGSIPAAGTDTLSVTFTPTDTLNYTTATKTVQITVTQDAPVITWANPANITYGTALSATQLNATASVPGTLVYTPAAGSIPAAGIDTLSVTFTPTDTANYSTVTKTVQINVAQAGPVITWADPASITYGTALSGAQLNATTSVPGTLVYTPAAGSIPAAGTDTLSVTFTPTDTTNYTSTTKTVTLVVTQTSPVITWASPASIPYGTALSAAQLNATTSVPGTLVYTPPTGSIPAAGTDTLSVTFTPTDTANYTTATKTVQLVVTQVAPVITWATPAAITYGTALSAAQLNATASVPGTLVYTPAAGTVPSAGTVTLSVTFTPTDTTNYTSATKTVDLIVNQNTPVITWNTPASIVYGTALSNTQLNATASVPGTLVYTPAAGTIPAVGTDTLSVTFTPTDTANYGSVTKTVQLVVTQAAPVVIWNNPASITYGTALSSTQLNATASVPGTFAYTPAIGNVPAAGTDTLSVTFTPTDTTSYSTVTKTVTLTVTQAASVITWAPPASIVYGTALSNVQLNSTASVPGTLVYTPAAGSIPAAGTDTLSVTFTPTDATNYTTATKTVQIIVTQSAPVITWTPPAAITYGTALSSTQLNATASVPGALVYTPAAGTVPSAGTITLSVTFTPTDTTDYTSVTKTVQLTVNPATSGITWNTPASIVYGTPLSSVQLDATASDPGTLVYTPAAGAILPVGTNILSVTFTPTDTTNHSSATQTVQLVVTQAAPVITWANPAGITYGTALSATQLNATASVPGIFVYTPAAGSIPAAGTDTLSVTFTPTDTTNYSTVTKTVQITVTQATPVITWSNPASITYGTALSATQLDATASVPGTLVYTPAAGSIPAAGTDTLSVTFTPTDTTNYTTATKTVQIIVTQAGPVITWSNPASITYGTALSSTQLNATGSVPGTLVYSPAAGSIPAAGTDTLSVTFTPTDTTNYTTATKTVQITVTQAAPVITWANPATITYGTALSATQLSATASVPGTLVYTPAAGSIPAAGTDTLSVTFTPTDTTNYTTATKTVQITVTQDAPVITWANPADITYGTALSSTQLNATASVPGTLVYTPAAGSIPAAGTDTLSVTFTPTDTTSYTTVTKTVQITVTQATPVITWSDPASITYGTTLSATQLNATASVPGTLVYTPAAGSIPAAGTDTLSVTFTPTDTTNYTTVTKTVQITVTQAGPVITWSNPASITYGTALSATQLKATASVPGTLVYTPAAGSIPAAGTDTLSVTFTPTDTTNYTTATKTVQITVTQAPPVITWSNPASITYGTALSATQLNATASVPGTLVYTPAAGSIPAAGTDTLSVTFTPTDTSNYTTATKTVQITVTQDAPVITWANPASITYGTALSATQLNATASVPGTLVYTPAAGSIPAAGTDTLSVTFTPTDPTSYTTVTKTVQITVTQAAPVITWNNPASITYGTALSATQLDATASVPGVLVYTPAAGSIPAAGTDTLSVTFTPTDTTNYSTVTKTVQIVVTQAGPVITWSNPASITYGTALSATQLNATASVPGTLVYTPAAGSIPAAGTDTLSVTFTPTDTTNYTTATKTVQITVTQAAPVITWSNPASITYGTALSATQLNATASVPGTMVYTPAAGSIPAAGTDTLSVTFTPTDTTNYTTATKAVQITVTQDAPVITWANPASITYGTALSATQLNATASVPGTLVYTPAAGSIPAAGTDTLSVTFTPTDTTNYTSATKTVQITVTQATPVITWASPAGITYGTALSATQLNATASVPGTLVYTPAAGNIPAAGTDTLSVTFTPTDTTNYSTVTKTVQITVAQAAPVITWAPPAGITYDTALSATQLDATASVPGTLVYTPAAGSIPAAGTDTLSVTFTPTDITNYTTATKTVQITVSQAGPVITWANPASITYGTALSATQLNATASVPGTLVYTPAAGSIPAAGTDTLSVTFTPTDTANYTAATKTVQITVTQAAPVITWANPASITYGTALSATQLNATASVPGTLVYTPAAGSIPAAGTDTLSVTFTPTDTANYTTATKTVQITVNQSVPVITWAAPASIVYGTALSATQLNATASVPGAFIYTPAAGSIPAAGTDTLSVTFTPTDTSNYSTVTQTVQITVTQATPVITWANPAGITYGTVLSAAQLNATASVPGTLVYTPAAGSIPAAGADTLSVTFTPTDTANYTTATKTVQLTVSQATPVITWVPPAGITYGTALSAAQLNATASVPGTLVYTPATGSILAAGTDTLSVTFTPTDSANYTGATKTVQLIVSQATPVITWATPVSITYGTALSTAQLNATASVAGTFVYTPALGSVPTAGTDALSVTFTPTDTANYATATQTVQLIVNQAAPVITWANPAGIVYGTALSATQLNATASVPGNFVYTPVLGNVPTAGTDTLSVTFTPNDTTNYSTVTKTVQLTVSQATPTITWSNPAGIVYGTALSAIQLNATASVPGSFAYTPATGSIPTAGTDTLSVTFTPTDSTNYTTATAAVQLVVSQATPTITWAAPAGITYGTPLSAAQLNATTTVPGSFVYTPAAGSVLTAGTDALTVTFTPTDTANYTSATKTIQLTVGQATPTITWPTPASFSYGTALSGAQLNATSPIAGSFTYTPVAGSIPPAGVDTLSVTFTPTDTIDYTTATKTVQLLVSQTTPTISWATPAAIFYGTPLSTTQLDAAAYQLNGTTPLDGTFVYTPAAGSVLSVGSQQLSVTFTPNDMANYTTATKTVSLTVSPATLTISANSYTRLYGLANPIFQGTITGVQNGDIFTESFSSAASLTSDPGQYPIVPAASGARLSDYVQVVQNGTLTVTKAPVVVTTALSTPSIAYGLNVTMTASVASTTSGVPTGTIKFLDNGNAVGSAVLSNGVATFTTAGLTVGTHVIVPVYSGDTDFIAGAATASSSGANTVLITPLDFTLQVISSPTVEGIYGTTRQYTLHIAPIGGTFPGDVQFTTNNNGPLLSTYTFSPATVSKTGGPTDIILTVKTRKLASNETPNLPGKLSPIAFGLFLLPILGLRYSRRTSKRLARIITNAVLLLASLGVIGAMSGCGSGYFDHNYPITITATSNGIQHSVTVDFHIDQSPQ